MDVGYGFLHSPPLRRPEEPESVEQSTLEGLKRYMCPVSHGDFRRCGNCQGLKTCKVGQRIEILLAKKQQQQEDNRWKKVLEPVAESGNLDEGKRGLLKTACESGNAWNYIMETMGLSRDAAKETLLALIRKYPGVAAEYGGSRRIMQRPRAVTIVQVDPEKAENMETQEETTEENQNGISSEPEKMKAHRAATLANVEKAKAFYRECLASGDPVAYYMRMREVCESTAKICWRRMMKKYGDPNPDPECQTGIEQSASVEQAAEIVGMDETAENSLATAEPTDEISLVDFLRQYDVNPDESVNAAEDASPENRAFGSAIEKVDEAVPLAVSVICDSMNTGNAIEKLQAAKLLLDCFVRLHAKNEEGWQNG